MAEQISLFDGTQPFKIDKPIRLIELFAGIGAQAKALENLGVDFEHYRICEFDKYAVKSYNAIHGTNFETSDITKITANDLSIVDTDKYCYVMTYSFPCQDLSNAGNGKGMTKGSGTRSGLLWEVERLLTETKELPQVLLMENVPQVIGQKNMPDFAKWIAFLDGLGYKSKYALLNAKDYGIPQNRERCFMVSIHGDYFYEFPKKIGCNLKPIDLIDLEVDKKYFVSKKTKNAIEKTLGRYSHLLTEKPISTIVSSVSRNYRGTVVVYDDYNGKVRTDQNAICCLTTNSGAKAVRNGQKIIINGEVRIFTPVEVYRFMGFTDNDFTKAKKMLCENFFKGKDKADSQLYKQAGNSIVVQVLEVIFKQML
jgi:DNA (cytosine-5)-methyltransferase 1